MASPGQASPDALRSCLLCDPLSHSVRRKHGYEHLCLNRFDQCLSPSLDCSFVWTKTIPTVSWSPHCLIEGQAQTALQRYLLNDVGVGHPTGRSELGAGGVHIGQVLPGSHKTLQRDTQKPIGGEQGQGGGVESSLVWATDTWDCLYLCICGVCSHPSLGLSLPTCKMWR